MSEEQKSIKDIVEAPISEEEIQHVLAEFAAEKIQRSRILNIITSKFAEVEAKDLIPKYLYVGPKFFSYMRKLTNENFEMTTLASEMKKGIMGKIWGATIICEKRNDEYFVEARPEEEEK